MHTIKSRVVLFSDLTQTSSSLLGDEAELGPKCGVIPSLPSFLIPKLTGAKLDGKG